MGTLAFSAIWGLASVIGIAADCDHGSMLTTTHSRQCPEQVSNIGYMPLGGNP